MRRFLLAFSLLALLAAPAFAQPQGPYDQDRDHQDWSHEERSAPPASWHKDHGRHRGQAVPVPVSPRFDDARRSELQAYYHETYRGECPPGFYSRHGKCKRIHKNRRYHVGGFLPRAYKPAPPALVQRLGPPPQGAFYALVDNDVVLATEATKKILDAVTLFSAMQK